jgi:hypothetical protein
MALHALINAQDCCRPRGEDLQHLRHALHSMGDTSQSTSSNQPGFSPSSLLVASARLFAVCDGRPGDDRQVIWPCGTARAGIQGSIVRLTLYAQT